MATCFCYRLTARLVILIGVEESDGLEIDRIPYSVGRDYEFTWNVSNVGMAIQLLNVSQNG